MNKSGHLKRIQQKVNRESQQDGITEIFMGLFFLFYTFIFDNLCKGVRMESPIFIFFILVSIYPIVYFKLIRNHFTYPRMGYVDIKEKITLGFALSVVLPLIFLPIVMYLIVWVLNDFPGIASVIRWMAVAFGLVFGALYFSYAKKFGRKTYYVLMIVSVIAGAVFSQFSLALAEPAVVILLNSFILLIFGVSLLIRFHHRYPKPRKIRVEYNADAEDQDSQADNG